MSAHYEIEQRGATEATVRVTVEPEAFREELEAVFRRYAREVRIPGFRKGHIPRNVLESRFGRETFLEETREELERRHLPEALFDLGLRPVSRPRLDVVPASEADPFVFTASFSVLPEVELPSYRGRAVSVPPVPPVTDEDVARALEDVRSQFATLEEKQGETVSEGDIVHVREGKREWDARVDGEHPVLKGLVGARVGSDVEIDATTQDGERLQTTLHVLGLREVVLPEVDDELAKDAGLDSLDALKKDIEEKIGAARQERFEQIVEAAVLDQVVADADIPLPASFVEDLVNDEIEHIKASLEERGPRPTFEEYLEERGTPEEAFRGEVRDSVERRLRRELVVRRIAADAGIEIDEEELDRLAREDAEAAGEDPLRFVARLKAEDRWGDYRTSKTNGRVYALLRESAEVTTEEPTPSRVIDPTKDGTREGLIIDPTKKGGGA